MKNKIMLSFIFIILSSSLFGQAWRTEYEKYEHLTVKEIISKMESYFDEIGTTRANKYHHWLRYRERLMNHADSKGYYTDDVELKKQLLKKFESRQNKTISSQSRHFQGAWESVNPQNNISGSNNWPLMGRVNCIAVPPSNGNIIYAGAATGGVWKTYNHGASWTPLWDGMVQMGVSDIIIDNNNENHILAVTGDGDGSDLPYGGTYHSYDGGSTWSLLFEGFSSSIFAHKIVQSKSDPDIYYLVIKGGSVSILTYDITDPTNFEVENSQIKSQGTDIEYVAGFTNRLFAATRTGLLKKVEPGEWEAHDVSGLPTSGWGRTELAMSPNIPNVMYYMVATGPSNSTPGTYGIYKSVNGGDSFTQVYDTSDPDFISSQSSYNFSMVVDQSNSNKIHVGAVNFYTSTDSGNTFTLDNSQLHPDNHGIYFFNDKQYVCTDGGLSYRDMGDTDFINISNGLNISQYYKIDVSGNRIVGGTQDNGTIFWDEGDVEGVQKLGGDGFDCLYHPTDDDIVFLSTQEFTYRSTNNGATYSEVVPNRWASPIQFWPFNTTRMITFDKNDMRLSYDTGQTWPDSIDLFTDNSQLISGFSQCQVATNTAYACNIEQVLRSDDFNNLASSEWNDFTTGLNTNSIFRNILVHPDDCGEVYVTLAGYQGTQIYKSENGGLLWEKYADGLDNIPVYCIYYDHVNGNGFYIGTEFGVYYRNKDMTEWIPFSTYLPRVQVMDMNITDTHIYAGTYGRGVWKSEGYKPCVESMILSQTNDPTFGTSSGHQVHKASNVIYSDRIIRGKAGTEVTYQAGNFIELVEGFHAKYQNEFTAKAAGCDE